MSDVDPIEDLLRRCETGLASSWPALTSERKRIVAAERKFLLALEKARRAMKRQTKISAGFLRREITR